MTEYRKIILCFLSSIILIPLSGCGFHPMYGKNKYTPVGAEDILTQVQLGNIPDYEGQYLRNLLIDRFYRKARPSETLYSLHVTPIQETSSDLDITKSSDTTRAQLRLQTSMVLNAQDGTEILSRDLQSITSYNILGSEFATRVTKENARKNALEDLARQIELQITLYLKRN